MALKRLFSHLEKLWSAYPLGHCPIAASAVFGNVLPPFKVRVSGASGLLPWLHSEFQQDHSGPSFTFPSPPCYREVGNKQDALRDAGIPHLVLKGPQGTSHNHCS